MNSKIQTANDRVENNIQPSFTCYGISGEALSVKERLDESRIYAKHIVTSNGTHYSGRINGRGKLSNPFDPQEQNDDKNIARIKSSDFIRYGKISKEQFLDYVKFLETKDKGYLNRAQKG